MKKQSDPALRNTVKWVAAAVIFGVLAFVTAMSVPLVRALMRPDASAEFERYIAGLGPWSFLGFIAVQVAQVLIAVIPGEPFEFAAGVLYGAWGGAFLCYIGLFVGSLLVFRLVRRFGMPLVTMFFPEEKLRRFRFMHDRRRAGIFAFVLFLIPGTPKDLLTYLAPLTEISEWQFYALSLIARLPSVLTSVLAGASLGKGDFAQSAVIYGAAAALGAIGIVVGNRFIAKSEREHGEAERAKKKRRPKK